MLLPRWLNRLICWVGLHKWGPWSGGHPLYRYCKVCGKQDYLSHADFIP